MVERETAVAVLGVSCPSAPRIAPSGDCRALSEAFSCAQRRKRAVVFFSSPPCDMTPVEQWAAAGSFSFSLPPAFCGHSLVGLIQKWRYYNLGNLFTNVFKG